MNDKLDSIVERADRALATMHDASETLSALRVMRRSVDGLVTVLVDGTGAMIDLELGPDLSRTSVRHLEAAIVATASEAATEALRQRARILEQMQSSLSGT